jgi:hypothetical protein
MSTRSKNTVVQTQAFAGLERSVSRFKTFWCRKIGICQSRTV